MKKLQLPAAFAMAMSVTIAVGMLNAQAAEACRYSPPGLTGRAVSNLGQTDISTWPKQALAGRDPLWAYVNRFLHLRAHTPAAGLREYRKSTRKVSGPPWPTICPRRVRAAAGI